VDFRAVAHSWTTFSDVPVNAIWFAGMNPRINLKLTPTLTFTRAAVDAAGGGPTAGGPVGFCPACLPRLPSLAPGGIGSYCTITASDVALIGKAEIFRKGMKL
jgi:hypothetical protein